MSGTVETGRPAVVSGGPERSQDAGQASQHANSIMNGVGCQGPDARDRARGALRSLLAGTPLQSEPNGLGVYGEPVTVVAKAFAESGKDGAKKAFAALAKKDPELGRLLAEDSGPRRVEWTAAELLAADFPPIRWVVPGLLPEGLTFLAGKRKIGKSWAALQIALAVATGGVVLKQRVKAGRVLYLALEDSPKRLKARMQVQSWPRCHDVTFATAWLPLDQGGLAELQRRIDDGGYCLVIIDTLSRALSARQDQMDLSAMTAVLSNLQRVAQDRAMAVLLVDHHSKASGGIPGSDPVDDVIGSSAKVAVADSILGLYRKRGERGAILRATGRDIEDAELALEWIADGCYWELLGNAEDVRQKTLQDDLLAAVDVLGGEATTSQLAEHLGKDRGNVSRELAELLNKGLIKRLARRGKEQPYGRA
jgi:DNA-binding transcriptional ArsR family regulator